MPEPHIAKLFVLVGLAWAAIVGPVSFVLILTHVGATNSQIGIFAAIAAVLSMVFQPIWGLVSDKIGSPRKMLGFSLVGSLVFFSAVFFTDSLSIVVVLLLFEIAFRCGVIGLLDSHTITEVNKVPGLQYGHIRLAGAVFFGSVSLVYSYIIDGFNVMAIIPISAVVISIAIYWTFFVAKESKDTEVIRTKPNLKKDAIALLKNRRFLILLIFFGFVALGMQPFLIYAVQFVDSVGGTPGDVLILNTLRCVIEIPTFLFIAAKCRRAKSKTLMAVGVFFLFLYAIILFFATTFFGVAMAHMFGGTLGFVFILTGRLRYVEEVTPESVRSTSILLMGTMEIGLGAIIGNLMGGFILDLFGTRVLSAIVFCFFVMAAIVLIFLKGGTINDEPIPEH